VFYFVLTSKRIEGCLRV